MDDALQAKRERLFAILREMGRVVVAFSGGVDSSYLLSAAADALGADQVLAVTADSPLLPMGEMDTAQTVAQELGVAHRSVPFDELAIPDVAANPPRRCYYCKRARFEALLALAAQARPSATLVHGENADDHLDYRPGSQAAQELRVHGPLAEAGLTKAEIRLLSRQRGLPTWDHPAASCLATRFPYGVTLTAEGLRRVGQAEHAVHELAGIRQVRVRDHYPVARIEAPTLDLSRLAESPLRERVVAALRALGYGYVTLDLAGYRMGSMNEGIATSVSQPE